MRWIEKTLNSSRRPLAEYRRMAITWAASALLTLSSFSLLNLRAAPPPEPLHVATFDSGFGGYLTAKSIEGAAASLLRDYDTMISIRHYGDTKNLPYGEKTPAQIATLGSAGVLKAFEQGADMVFIACNTASTQYESIRRAVDQAYPGKSKPVVSIIDASTHEAKRLLDQALTQQSSATFTILATPATVKSMMYPRKLASLYAAPIAEEAPRAFAQPRWFKTNGATVESLTQKSVITLPKGRHIDVFQLAPANWVELIEHGADPKAKQEAVRRDLGLLSPQLAKGSTPVVVGYFCTHFPIFDATIRSEMASQFPGTRDTSYISQGQLMAKIFQRMAEERLKEHPRQTPIGADLLRVLTDAARANITISGQNGATIRDLARTMFPNDPAPIVTEENLGSLNPPK
jgi:glutamate racemase